MAQLSRGHFHGKFMRGGELLHVRRVGDEAQAKLPRDSFHEAKISGGGPSAQLMIEVSHDQTPAMSECQLVQNVEQHHRIHAAGNGHEHLGAILQQVMARDIFLHEADKLLHGGICISAELVVRA